MLRLRSRVGPKGQIVIPKPIRDEMDLTPGQDVYLWINEGHVILEKKTGLQVLDEFVRSFPKGRLPKHIDWDEEHYSEYR